VSLIADWQHVTHRLLAALDGELSDLGLSAAETNALAGFGGATSRTVRELVDATGHRPSTFTGVLDRLERRGLIERRPYAADRRSILVDLTPAGTAAAARVAGAFAALERRIAERMPGGDVGRVLAAVAAVLDEHA
jgi:MarR family transcriptional regulator, organic hydroperoxide resistance regulator